MIAAATAAILAFLLHGFGATFTIMVARQACPELAQRVDDDELSAHLDAGLLCRCALLHRNHLHPLLEPARIVPLTSRRRRRPILPLAP